ncbi:peptidase, partial [Candidatus Endoriftia persephone str. Guaymas]|nr:peptidase [Candidatus Endoriftia persephone str. Guaymas]
MRHHLPVVCLCCALLSVGGAFADLSAPPGREVAAGGENSQPLPPLLLTLVSGLPNWSHLADFYQAREGRPVWHQHERLNPWGLVLLEWIENASTEGLNPVEYHLSTCSSWVIVSTRP